jgi:L-threonylcarbamoyladenylate synthase
VETEVLAGDAAGIARAAELLRAGRLVAFPTETVYGLGGLAGDPAAVAAIYAAKGRPQFNPLIAHVASVAAARSLGRFDARAEALAAAFWPGPLTLVLDRLPGAPVADLLSAGLPTVAIRVPAHDLARALLGQVGAAVAAPSANPSGKVSPTTAAHVREGLRGRIDAVLDGGPCAVGVESTILSLVGDGPVRLLRPGGVPVEAIEAVLGAPVVLGPDEARPTAPGQLASHYAPRARVVLEAATRPEGALWLGFGPGCDGAEINLSETGDPVEAAARLFAALRTLDARAAPGQAIAVAPVPDAGLGRAINDRLRRAAAPR